MYRFPVIPPVSLRLFFLCQSAAAFPVDMEGASTCRFPIIFPEQIFQSVQQTGCRKECGRVTERIQMVEEKLRINIALCGGCLQKQHCLFPVAWDIMATEIELTKNILCKLVILPCSFHEPSDCGIHILWQMLPGQIQFA